MIKVNKTKIFLYFRRENIYESHGSHRIQPFCLVYKLRTPCPRYGLYKTPFYERGIILQDTQVVNVAIFFKDIFNPTQDEYDMFNMLTGISAGNFLDELQENDWLSIL